ncbi:hypothetical protein HYU14_00930 [Candidatus Woesearchaeota archaeon]|nr:hypothetical protein [Candidatus Woesearchaeota archaeon]
MTGGLKFLHEFFTKKKYDAGGMTITLDERPAFDISSEDYRFRVVIAEVVDEVDIYYRDMAIEDHHQQAKHQRPHLQFKLHADGVGHIHIFLPISDAKDYRKYILSFLDIIGSVLVAMDNEKKELQHKFMISGSFDKIKGMGDNIKRVVYDSYKKGELTLVTLDKEIKVIEGDYLKKIKDIPQIAPFFERV